MKFLIQSITVFLATTSLVFAGTKIDLISDFGDYIGQGKTYSYSDNNASITYARNYGNGITVTIRNLPGAPSLNWTMNIAAPANAEIQPGVYAGAERFPFQSAENPGLSFTGEGRGCNTLTGSFMVYEVAYDVVGSVTALSASFEQHCEGNAAALRGNIAFNIIPPVGVSAVGMAPNYVECKNNTTRQKIRKSVSANNIDCKKLGLNISPGDDIQMKIIGTAEQ